MIFGQGFLPLALDNSISNCRAAVLVLVHPGYSISPVPTISGERSPIRHLGEAPDGRLATSHFFFFPGERRKRGRPRKTWMEGVRAAMRTRHLEEDQWLNRKEWCLGSGRRRLLSQDWKDR